MIKLELVKGKAIIFVSDVDRCYRLKLFFEQFGIRSCLLNSELPVNCRIHAVEEFNRGVYNIIIASDENEVVGEEKDQLESTSEGASSNAHGDATNEMPENSEQARPLFRLLRNANLHDAIKITEYLEESISRTLQSS